MRKIFFRRFIKKNVLGKFLVKLKKIGKSGYKHK